MTVGLHYPWWLFQPPKTLPGNWAVIHVIEGMEVTMYYRQRLKAMAKDWLQSWRIVLISNSPGLFAHQRRITEVTNLLPLGNGVLSMLCIWQLLVVQYPPWNTKFLTRRWWHTCVDDHHDITCGIRSLCIQWFCSCFFRGCYLWYSEVTAVQQAVKITSWRELFQKQWRHLDPATSYNWMPYAL